MYSSEDLEMHAMRLVMQDLLDRQKDYDERLSKLDSILSDVEDLKITLASEVKKRKVADLTAKLKFADNNCFGSKKQSVRKSKSETIKN